MVWMAQAYYPTKLVVDPVKLACHLSVALDKLSALFLFVTTVGEGGYIFFVHNLQFSFGGFSTISIFP